MSELGKLLIILGILLVVAGVLLTLLGRTNLPLGRLPGDIRVETQNGFFYFPITTCVIVSIVISVILWLIRR